MWVLRSLGFALCICCGVVVHAEDAKGAEEEVESLPHYTLRLALPTQASEAQIWSLWSQIERWTEYDERLEYARLDENERFENGAKGALKAEGGPRTRFELRDIEPGMSFVQRLKLPLGHTIDLHRYFASTQESTVFVHEVRFRGPLRAAVYFGLRGAFKKDLKNVMGQLREVAEGS